MEERNMSDDRTLQCFSDDQWWDSQVHDHLLDHGLQNYGQIATPGLGHDHVGRHDKLLTSTAPQTASRRYGTSVSPDNPTKQPIQGARPKQRRGRGGTMAATTFLNSTVTNFRELVQQHTGMSTVPPSSSSYYASCDQKGPITLCFANYSSSPSTPESALRFNKRNQ